MLKLTHTTTLFLIKFSTLRHLLIQLSLSSELQNQEDPFGIVEIAIQP